MYRVSFLEKPNNFHRLLSTYNLKLDCIKVKLDVVLLCLANTVLNKQKSTILCTYKFIINVAINVNIPPTSKPMIEIQLFHTCYYLESQFLLLLFSAGWDTHLYCKEYLNGNGIPEQLDSSSWKSMQSATPLQRWWTGMQLSEEVHIRALSEQLLLAIKKNNDNGW